VVIIAAVAVFGGIGPLVISSIALRRKKSLARGRYKVPWHTDDGRLPIGVKNMPSNEAGSLNGHHMIYRAEVAELAFDWWLLEVV